MTKTQIFSSFTGPSWQYMVNTVATKTNGAVPVTQGGTGATNVADARTNLGLGSSATRDAYSSSGKMLSEGDFGLGGAALPTGNEQACGFYRAIAGASGNPLNNSGVILNHQVYGANAFTRIATSYELPVPRIFVSTKVNATYYPYYEFYTTGNTTKASDGTLKAASPVVKLFADGSFETNDESEGCTVTRMKPGEYLIEGCMGMNSDAAWGGIDGGFDIPKDRNGQALIWLDYEVNADGSVLVKTFHREYPSAPIFARNSREDFVDGEPADIPADQFVSVRVEMPQNSIWNQRAAMAEVSDSSSD
ncbi:hypothetical protein P838_04474 [Enterobacter hormaechei]|nr:hypothetical protein [Enterobacter hormaechei]EUL59915.1 hypothetical protein P838_04474 [Enterobacter hormaechei]